MVHGILQDPAQEFFISRASDDTLAGGSSGAEQHAERQEGSDSNVYHDWHHGYKVRPKAGGLSWLAHVQLSASPAWSQSYAVYACLHAFTWQRMVHAGPACAGIAPVDWHTIHSGPQWACVSS